MAWIRALATPYLKGYQPVRVNDGALNGFWFCHLPPRSLAHSASRKAGIPPGRGNSAGFFVGLLFSTEAFPSLNTEPPECIVFACVHPAGGALHRRLVHQQGSLIRKTFEYIRWLTHRPPRFVYQEDELPALARHQPMSGWPEEKRMHLSRNFFIETLAWLVRSGLVRKLQEEIS